jgi:hypothetical protein
MSMYRIYFHTTASTSVEVEADDYEAAVEAAYDGLPGGICAQCAGWGSDGPGIDMGDDWLVDDTFHQVDGESVEVKA